MKQKHIPFLAIRPALFIMLFSMITIISCKESSGSKTAAKAEDDKSGMTTDLVTNGLWKIFREQTPNMLVK
jgi:hypothetical protein